jgi:hypothetical protein
MLLETSLRSSLFKETAKGNSLFDEAVTMSSLVSHRFKNSMFCSPENAMQATKYKNKNKGFH